MVLIIRDGLIQYSKNPNMLFEISQNVLYKHAPRKKKYIRGNNKPFLTKAYLKAIMQKTFQKQILKKSHWPKKSTL